VGPDVLADEAEIAFGHRNARFGIGAHVRQPQRRALLERLECHRPGDAVCASRKRDGERERGKKTKRVHGISCSRAQLPAGFAAGAAAAGIGGASGFSCTVKASGYFVAAPVDASTAAFSSPT